jgi:protease IV
MNQFGKFVFASCLGVGFAILAIIFLGFVSLVGLAALGDKDSTKKVASNSVLEVKLEQAIPELTDNIEKSPFESDKAVGVHAMVAAIKHAASDDKIKGIVLTSRFSMMEFNKVHALRQAVEEFKKSGKFVVSYAEFYTQSAYYLASVADVVMLNPNGNVEFKGFAAEIPFMKDLFDRLDVKWQIYYAGQFKSATEPFRLDKMSDQNRLQTRVYIDGIYNIFLDDVARTRKVSKESLMATTNKSYSHEPREAIGEKLIDTEGYYDEFQKILRDKIGLKEKDKIKSISISDYAQSYEPTEGKSKDRIAVVFAEGDIGYGVDASAAEQAGTIDGNRYAKIIRQLRKDDKVKAIVLRVNSGGGSAMASDIIWRELELCRQAGKPVISSFGAYAASGGYYIACASDSIFAEATTLTGSIGVFSMIPSFQKTFKNKLGISFDTVATGRFATGIGVNMDISPEQGRILQMQTDSLYETFLNRVGTCRKMSRDAVHNIAQGRVWVASQAKNVGLVDKIGGLDNAIAAAASKAGLKDYKTANYPKPKEPFQAFIENFMGTKPVSDNIKKDLIRQELGEMAEMYALAQKMRTWKGAQMRMPFQINLK